MTTANAEQNVNKVARVHASILRANALNFEVHNVQVTDPEGNIKHFNSAFQAIEIMDSYHMRYDLSVIYFGETYKCNVISDGYNIYLVFVENNVYHYLCWEFLIDDLFLEK